MKRLNQIKVPEQFIVSPFFNEGEVVYINSQFSFEEAVEAEPLLFDILNSLEISALKPWHEKDIYIPILLKKWGNTEPIIASYFRVRDRKKAKEPISKMICVLLAFIYWANGRPVPSLKDVAKSIGKLPLKPTNAEERIAYLMAAPDHHHSFSQLKQLFIEFKKKYAVAKLKRND